MANVFAYLTDDRRTLSQSSRVCRLWWSEGQRQQWRRVELRDLYHYVADVSRRQYLASLVTTIVICELHTILADEPLQPLSFPRLHTVNMYSTNLIDVRAANFESLMVPSLRSLTVESSIIYSRNERDNVTFYNALMPICASLTSLDLDIDVPEHHECLAVALLERMTAVKHLRLGHVAEYLHMDMRCEDFLGLLLSKSSLVTLAFPPAVDFDARAVQTFLTRMGPGWSLPSLRELSRPVFLSRMAAPLLLDRLPGLLYLELELEDRIGAWGDDLKHIFAALSKLEHLQSLDLHVNVHECDMDGAWLVQLAEVKTLEAITINFSDPGTVILTGTQLITFLAMPRLRHVKLDLGPLHVYCSPKEAFVIKRILRSGRTSCPALWSIGRIRSNSHISLF
jgi:hypothetical protein